MNRTRIASGIAIVVLLTACSGGGSKPKVAVRSETSDVSVSERSDMTTTTEKPTTTRPKNEPDKNVVSWVKAAIAGDPKVAETGLPLSAPGSPAFAYMTFQVVRDRAEQQSTRGISSSYSSTTQDDGSIKVCDDKKNCFTYDDFVVDAQGLVSTMTVEGNPLDGRAVVGNGQVNTLSDGATLTFVAAIQGNTADVALVAVEVVAGSGELTLQVPSGTSYIDPDGSQRNASFDSTVPSLKVSPGAKVDVIVVFPGAAIGGTMTIGACTNGFRDCSPSTFQIA